MTARDIMAASMKPGGRLLLVGGGGGRERGLFVDCGFVMDDCDYALTGIRYEETPLRAATYDGIFASHVLEHMRCPAAVLDRWFVELRDGGVLGVVVPPLKHEIVGGHLSLWNAGLLLYHLIRARFDCSRAAVRTYGYNVAVVVRKRRAEYEMADLREDSGDVAALSRFFPLPAHDGFDGQIAAVNWGPV